MSNKNEKWQGRYSAEIKQYLESAHHFAIKLSEYYKVSGIPELLELAGSDFESCFFTDLLPQLLLGNVSCLEAELCKAQKIAPAPCNEIHSSSAEGYGRWNATHKHEKRRRMSEKAKKRRIDRGRNNVKFDESGQTRDDLIWEEGYACKKYNQAKKALKKNKKRTSTPTTPKLHAFQKKKGNKKKDSSEKPLRWWKREKYLRDLKRHAPDVKLARHYGSYSRTQGKYFRHKASSEADKNNVIPSSVPEQNTSSNDSAREFVNSTTRISQKRHDSASSRPKTTDIELSPEYSNSLASFLVHFGYKQYDFKLPIAIIRARVHKFF